MDGNCQLLFQNQLKDITKITQDMKEQHKLDFKKLRNKVIEFQKYKASETKNLNQPKSQYIQLLML